MSKRPNPKPPAQVPGNECKYKVEKPRQPLYFLVLIVAGYICLAASWASKNLYAEPFSERAKDLQERINLFQSLTEQARDVQAMELQTTWHKDSLNPYVKSDDLKLAVYSTTGLNFMLRTFETEKYHIFPSPGFSDSLKSEQLKLNSQKQEVDTLFGRKQFAKVLQIRHQADSEYIYLSTFNIYPAKTAWGYMNEYKYISENFNNAAIWTLVLGTLMITATKILSWMWGNKV